MKAGKSQDKNNSASVYIGNSLTVHNPLLSDCTNCDGIN